MSVSINQNGVWINIEQVHINENGTWREVQRQYVNNLSTWRTVIPDIGELWSWGQGTLDSYSVPANNYLINSDALTPISISVGGINWAQISSGQSMSAGIKDDGTLWTWGSVTVGPYLGRIYTRTQHTEPQIIYPGSTDWIGTTNPEDLYTVSSGGRMNGAIKTDGTLWMWGPNDVGQLGIPSFPLYSQVGISSHAKETPVTTFSGGTDWKQLSCGYQHAAAIKTDGTLWMWGSGSNGELGISDTTNRSTPVTTFAGGNDWKQVSCGQSHTLAVKTDGTLWTWGSNDGGKLGVFNRSNLFGSVSTPTTTFVGGTDWKHCSAGHSHSAAVKTNGTLWTWGRTVISVSTVNGRGLVNEQNEPYTDEGDRLGRSTYNLGERTLDFSSRLTPVTTFIGATNWLDTPTSNPELMSSISVGTDHSAAIKTDGTLWLWGANDQGQLGNNQVFVTPTSLLLAISYNWGYATPVTTFSGGANWKQVSCGHKYTAAIKTDGTLWLWGTNQLPAGGVSTITGGWLGNHQLLGLSSTPITTFVGGNNWKQVSCGYYHVAAIKTDGTLWTWGNDNNYKSGQAAPFVASRSRPSTTFAGGTNWKQVSAGKEHTAAVKTDGTLWVWGNKSGLGTNNFSIWASTPVTTFVGGSNWKQVSCGRDFTLAVKTDGTLWTWGNEAYGQLGNSIVTFSTNIRSIPLQTWGSGTDWAYVNNTAAIKTDGTLWTWGKATGGVLANNTAASPFNVFVNMKSAPMNTGTGTNWSQVQKSQSGFHAMGLKTDGTLWVWGNNRHGQLGICRNNSSYDPNFIDWDASTNLSTPLPNTTFAGGNNWKQVSCGRFHTAAVKTDGTLWTWGQNSSLGSVVGALGRNSHTSSTNTPITTFAGGNNWKQVSCGHYNTSAVKTDGTLWVWGAGTTGLASTWLSSITHSVPTIAIFGDSTNWSQVSIGSSSHVTALKTDGTIWTWGNTIGSTKVTTGTKDYVFGIKTKSGFVPNPVEGNNWKQVAISANSYNNGVAIKTDGTLWTWGNGSRGTLGTNNIESSSTPVTTFVGGTDWKQVSISSSNNIGNPIAAIKTDGTLWMWGYSDNYSVFGDGATIFTRSVPNTTIVGGNDWKSVDISLRCVAAIKTDGTLWVWGNNVNGAKIQENSFTNQSTPTTTALGGTDWKKVSVADYSISALKTDGTLWTWGNNAEGGIFLGRSDAITSRITPITTFAGGTDWANPPTTNAEDLYTISASTYSTGAIKTDGTLWMWGYNQYAQLGQETSVLYPKAISTPSITFAGGTNWRQISSGKLHSAAIKTDGTLWLWGNSTLGNIKDIDDPGSQGRTIYDAITTFVGGTDWKQVSCGNNGDATAAIKTDGTLWLWGREYNNENVVNYTHNKFVNRSIISITPITTFAGGTDWADPPTTNAEDLYTISLGGRIGGAIKTDGTLWTWGNNSSYGGIGILGKDYSQTPIQILPATTWRSIACSINRYAAIKTDGTLWLWGRGGAGEMGNTTFTNASIPVTTFAGGTNWKQVSTSAFSVGAIKTDGTLWMWGQSTYGKLGVAPTNFSRSTPVTTSAGGTNWKQVSCGKFATAAIKTDGSLWRWGRCNNFLGGPFSTTTQNTNPTSLGANSPGSVAWKQVSCGEHHAGGIKTDGTLWMWGNNTNFGLLGTNSSIANLVSTPVTTFAGGNNWKQVSCEGVVTAAIKTDGTLWTWGHFPLGHRRYDPTTYINMASFTPVTTFAGGTNWSQVYVSAGPGTLNNDATGHVIARKTDGTLWVWGGGGVGLNNLYGYGLAADVSNDGIPQKPRISGDGWNQICVHYRLGAGVKTDGTLWLWGNNTDEQLGINVNSAFQSGSTTPVTTFTGGTNWKQVSVGYHHVLAVKTDGSLFSWGSSTSGALGTNTLNDNREAPGIVGSSYNWKQVSCGKKFGNNFSAGVKTDGTLWTWGANSFGQLGTADTIWRYTPVTTFAGGTDWVQVECGENHIVASKIDGTLWTWGGNEYESFSSFPVFASTLGATSYKRFFGTVDGSWKGVSSQEGARDLRLQVTAAIKTDGTLWTWGNSNWGGLGNNASGYSRSAIPITTILGGNNWVSVDVGNSRVNAIKKTGL